MKIKVNKHKLNINYRGSPWGSRTQQHAYCLRYAHSHHIESHLGKKQPQVKIAIAFLFGQLHFNNVTSHALFYGGHLVMRSKRCAVQNQGITLIAVFVKRVQHCVWMIHMFSWFFEIDQVYLLSSGCEVHKGHLKNEWMIKTFGSIQTVANTVVCIVSSLQFMHNLHP